MNLRRPWMFVFAAVVILLVLRLANGPFFGGGDKAPVDSPQFVTRQGTNLLLNGEPYRFTGINMYTANLRDNCVSGYSGGYNNSVLSNDLTEFNNATGGRSKVIRAWFFQKLATTNGARDWRAFDHTLAARDWRAFDHTLAVARRHGFKVIAVLADGHGTCEARGAKGPNGLGYRDISFYQGGYTQAPDVGHPGGPSEGGITSYRQWVREVVSRYANNPTIFAWQLMNEANAYTYEPGGVSSFRCPSESAAYHALVSWATAMTQLVKSVDHHHLVNIGTLDDSCGTEQNDNVAISSIAGNDFCDYHDYSAPYTTIPSALSRLIAACKRIARPVIVDELGIDLSDRAINNNLAVRAQHIAAKMAAEFQAGVAGILPWIWSGNGQSISGKYAIEPGDPVLAVLRHFGMAPPAP